MIRLAVFGDIAPEQVKTLAAKYFENMPAGSSVTTALPSLSAVQAKRERRPATGFGWGITPEADAYAPVADGGGLDRFLATLAPSQAAGTVYPRT